MRLSHAEKPRVVLCAYSEVGAVCLETLLEMKAHILGVFTYRDDPGETVWFRSVEEMARKARLRVYTSQGLQDREDREKLLALEPDLLLSCYYRDIIPPKILQAPSLGAYNMHGSYLPRYRGRASINWAILRGERETGVTLHVMTERPDQGDMVDQLKIPIPRHYNALDLSMDCAVAAGKILRRSWKALCSGSPPRIPQDQEQASYFGGRRPKDGLIHWDQSAEEIYNLVRAVTRPWPGAFTVLGGKKVFIWWGQPLAENIPQGVPGEILSLAPLKVCTGQGIFVVETAQTEGGLEQTGTAWALAKGLAPGQRLGIEFPVTTGGTIQIF